MPKKKKETLVHLDIAELTKKPSNETEIPKDQSLGDILFNARKKKHLDIEDISTTLCIKPIYIEALEKGHYYVFPARAYTVGFLRTYAQFLKLDTDEILQLFYQETTDTKEEPMDMLVIEKKMALPSKKTLAIVIAIFIAFYVIWYLIAKSYSPPHFAALGGTGSNSFAASALNDTLYVIGMDSAFHFSIPRINFLDVL